MTIPDGAATGAIKAASGSLPWLLRVAQALKLGWSVRNRLEEARAALSLDEQRRRYLLVETPAGFHAYQIRSDGSHGESTHYCCQPCFDRPGGKRVVLQPRREGLLACTECNAVVRTKHSPPPPVLPPEGEHFGFARRPLGGGW